MVPSVVVEPDHVKWACISEALVAVQIAAIQTVEQVRKPLSVRSELVCSELELQRVVRPQPFDGVFQEIRQFLDFQ